MYFDFLNQVESDEERKEKLGENSGICTRIKIYFYHMSGFLYQCCCPLSKKEGREKIKKLSDHYHHIHNILSQKFDLMKIMINIATLKFNQERLLDRFKLKYERKNVMEIWHKEYD
jgi:hypothetical protein